MTFNDLLIECGEFGPYQKVLSFVYLSLTVLLVSCVYWTQIFILLIPPHRCKITPDDNEWISAVNSSTWDKGRHNCDLNQNNETSSCPYGFTYDFSLSFPTYSSEHDWVCENAWKMYLVHSCYWVGAVIGALLLGVISDKCGRKRAYQIAALLILSFDIITLFCPEQISFTIARFGAALGEQNISTIIFVLVSEYTGPTKRRINVFVLCFPYTTTSIILPWMAYYFHHWKYMLAVTWFPALAAVISSFFIPESASWLMTQGRFEEVANSVEKMARINGKKLERDYIMANILEEKNILKTAFHRNEHQTAVEKENKRKLEVKTPEEMSYTSAILATIKSPNLRKNMAFSIFTWFIACCCYTGNNLVINKLPSNMYIAFSVGAFVEVLGNILCLMIIDRLGRRWTAAALFVTGGVLGILSARLSYDTVILVLALVARLCYCSTYDVTFSFSSEVFPTVIRGRAVSIIRTFGNIGVVMAPPIVSLSEKETLLPLLIFGVLAIAGGIVVLFLPETAKQHLPHTIEDGENFGKDQSFWLCPFSQVNDGGNENKIRKMESGTENPSFETTNI